MTPRRASRAIKALSACNQAVVSATDEQTLLNEICRIRFRWAAIAWRGWVTRRRTRHAQCARWLRPDEKGYLKPSRSPGRTRAWARPYRNRHPHRPAVRIRTPSAIPIRPWRAEAIKRGYASVIGLPLTRGKHVFGALTIYAAELTRVAREVRLLTELAADLAYGITTLRTPRRTPPCRGGPPPPQPPERADPAPPARDSGWTWRESNLRQPRRRAHAGLERRGAQRALDTPGGASFAPEWHSYAVESCDGSRTCGWHRPARHR